MRRPTGGDRSVPEGDRPESTPCLTTEGIATEVGTVRVARLGDGPEPPLVLVHGYPDNLQVWSRVAPLLAAHRPVIAFDWPGLGGSDPIVSGATPFHLGRHFGHVMDALGVEACIPVGFDMGAHAVVAFVHANPDRVTRLVLSNFLALGDEPTSWDISVMRHLGLNRLVLSRAPRLVLARAERTFIRSGSPLSDAVRADVWNGFGRAETRQHLVKMCAGYQASLVRVAKLYPEIDTRTLVLWADRDPRFPVGQGEALSSLLGSAALRVLPGLGHWYMWDDPATVAAALLEA